MLRFKRKAKIQNEDGAVMVETALSLGMVLLIIFTAIDLLLIVHNMIMSQAMAAEMIRQITVVRANATEEDIAARIDNLVESVEQRSKVLALTKNFRDNVSQNISVCDQAHIHKCVTGSSQMLNAGGPNELVAVRISYDMEFTLAELLGFDEPLRISAFAMGRNEPF